MFDKITKKIISLATAAVLAMSNITSVYAEEITTAATTTTTATSTETATETTAAENEETELTYQVIELYPNEDADEKTVTLDGLMPEGAEAVAVDVSEQHDGVAAYDISITDGESEYQPGEENPIRVEIVDPIITENITLWHIHDDGTKEQIFDFTAENGRVSFYATGFSVYEIVDPLQQNDFDILEYLAERGEEGFDVSFIADELGDINSTNPSTNPAPCGPYYFLGTEYPNVVNTGRTGLNITTISETIPNNAAKMYFEHEANTTNQFYIYFKDGNGNKQYAKMFRNNNWNTGRSAIELVEKNNRTLFTLYKNNKNQIKIFAHLDADDNDHYWVRNARDNKYAVVGYASSTDKTLVWLTIHGINNSNFTIDVEQKYGIMYNKENDAGYALMANSGFNAKLNELALNDNKNYYVFEDSDITMWQFKNVEADKYKIYATIDGTVQYLKIRSDGTGLAIADSESGAQVFKVEPTASGKIKLSCEVDEGGSTVTKYIHFNDSNSSSPKFEIADTATELNFVKIADGSNGQKTYTANCISVSDGVNARTGQKLIVYTRLWDENKKKYDTYAIDHDGTLTKVFAYGDKIMWIDDENVTIFWDFTAYTWEPGTANAGKENGYYEFRNTFSNKYLAPQMNGQIISDNPIGVRMEGRKYEVVDGKINQGEYYSAITAWDKKHYDYAALYGDISDTILKTGYLADAGTFYFAIVGDEVYHNEQNRLHEVETIDNDEYGITMKMIDFNGTNNSHSLQDGILGDDTNFNAHPSRPESNILSTYLNENGYPTTKANRNLSDLYNAADLKTVNNLFIKSVHDSSGYFEFDSCQNFATLLDSNNNVTNNFTVYRELGSHSLGKDTLRHGQFFPYNTIKEGVYLGTNQNLYNVNASTNNNAAQGQLSNDDPRKYENLHNLQGTVNYQFGMEVEAKFVQTPSGLDAWGHDIIFEFTGDDDFWLYVDGELTIDLGGIHSALGGTVNFRTGEVNVNSVTKSLYNTFRDNYLGRDRTEADAMEYLTRRYCMTANQSEIRPLVISADENNDEFRKAYPTEFNNYKNAHTTEETETYLASLCDRKITLDEFISSHKAEYDSYVEEQGTIRANEHFAMLAADAGVTTEAYIAAHQNAYDSYKSAEGEAAAVKYYKTLCQNRTENITQTELEAAYPDIRSDYQNAHTDAECEEHFKALYPDRKITIEEYMRIYPTSEYPDNNYEAEKAAYLKDANNSPRKHDNEDAEWYLGKLFTQNDDGQWVFKDYTEHEMKIFYMERGAGASNLHMRFNLSAVTPGNVLFSKQLSVNGDADMDNSFVQYPFQIQWKYTDNEDEEWKLLGDTDTEGHITVSYQNSTQTIRFAESYIPANLVGVTDEHGDQIVYENVFFVIPGKYLEIKFPDNAMYYQIIECAVDSAVYDNVSASGPDGSEISLNQRNRKNNATGGCIRDLITSGTQVSEQPTIAFKNTLDANKIKALKIQKFLYDEKGDLLHYNPQSSGDNIDNTTFDFRLYLSDGSSQTMEPASLHRYYVTDANDYICKWDADSGRFVQYIKNDAPIQDTSSLSDEEKKKVTFYTSPYGAISNIPSEYKIIVPGLVTGAFFKVEERDYEIPIGYGLISYECVTDIVNGENQGPSYDIISDDESSGMVRPDKDARINVKNKRGIGLQAEKIWTDADFTTYHAPVYTAVYFKDSDTPLTNTLKEIKHPDTYVKYFFESLEDDKTIDDYEIYEVELQNPVYDENGNLTSYTSFTKLNKNDTISLNLKDQIGNEMEDQYTITYNKGTPKKSSNTLSGNNTREDMIKNIRAGGIEIRLNKWNTSASFANDIPLKGGTFTLKSIDQDTGIAKVIGKYTTDTDGIITIIYNFDKDENYNSDTNEVIYRLEENTPPDRYNGLAHSISFKVKKVGNEYQLAEWTNVNDQSDEITDNDNDPSDGKNWAEYDTNTSAQQLVARINIYNKYVPPESQDYYFNIEKTIYVDKNIHDSDEEQKFIFLVEKLDDQNAVEEQFYVTLNCGNDITDSYEYPFDSTAGGGKSFDSTNKEVTCNDGYIFPAAIWSGSKTVKVKAAGTYRVTEILSWSKTDYNFWDGSQRYIPKSGDAVNGIYEEGNPCVTFTVDSADGEQEDCACASFTNSESEFAYHSSQAWAENTIRLN